MANWPIVKAMQRWISPLLLVAVVFLVWPNNSPAPIIYRPGEGWSYESKDSVGKWRRDRAKSQLEVAKEAVTKKDWKIVYKAARRIVHEWPLSDYAPQAQLLLAESFEKRGNDERAFKEYQNLLTLYPQNVDYEDIQRRQIAIADRFLNGQRFKLWGRVPLFRSMRKTAGLYRDVVSLGPHSKEAPVAQMKIGLSWEKHAQGFHFSESERHKTYGRAVQAYKTAFERYKESDEIASNALFAAGMAYQNQSLDAEYDQAVTIKSIDSYSDLITLYPEHQDIPDAKKRIDEMKLEQARGNFNIARYYEKRKKWRGAEIYYDQAYRLAPDSEYGEKSKQRLAEIKKITDKSLDVKDTAP